MTRRRGGDGARRPARAGAGSVGGVDEVDDDVRIGEGGEGGGAHGALEGVLGREQPGVSARIIWASSVVWMPTMRSRVDWGLGLVMLSFWPMMRLRSVDLPALGLPTTVTMPARVMRKVVTPGSGAVEANGTEGIDCPRIDSGSGGIEGVPATAYSPAPSRAEYHRRCRA